jgi:hypothetical protein
MYGNDLFLYIKSNQHNFVYLNKHWRKPRGQRNNGQSRDTLATDEVLVLILSIRKLTLNFIIPKYLNARKTRIC